MSSKKRRVRPEAVILSAILVIGGCVSSDPGKVVTHVRTERVCMRDSNYFGLGFSFPCKEKDRARVAGAVCDVMGVSAHILIETNREIGPTSPEELFRAAYPAIKILLEGVYETMGKDAANSYIKDIADMSVYISQRNITDLVTYPREEFRSCMTTFKFPVH